MFPARTFQTGQKKFLKGITATSNMVEIKNNMKHLQFTQQKKGIY